MPFRLFSLVSSESLSSEGISSGWESSSTQCFFDLGTLEWSGRGSLWVLACSVSRVSTALRARPQTTALCFVTWSYKRL